MPEIVNMWVNIKDSCFCFLISLKKNWLLKEKAIAMHLGVHSIHRNKMHNNSTKRCEDIKDTYEGCPEKI